ncbi:MAG: hypothetical protein JWO34_1060 [Arthrobacter sp.]|nr:hypothetical protein [Arthrobacter sp.]
MPVGDGTGFDEEGGVRGVQARSDVPEAGPPCPRGNAGDVRFEFLGRDLELPRQEEQDQLRSGCEVRAGQRRAKVDQLVRGVVGVPQVVSQFGRVQEDKALPVDEGLPSGEHHGPGGPGGDEVFHHVRCHPRGGSAVDQRGAHWKNGVLQVVGEEACSRRGWRAGPWFVP